MTDVLLEDAAYVILDLRNMIYRLVTMDRTKRLHHMKDEIDKNLDLAEPEKMCLLNAIGFTLEEIGELYGISKQRVSQLMKQAGDFATKTNYVLRRSRSEMIRYLMTKGYSQTDIKKRLPEVTMERIKIASNEYKPNFGSNNSRSRIVREMAIEVLGGTCKECGHTDIRVLQIDHIHNDGNIERKKYGAQQYYNRICRDPEWGKERYQVLCANCNWSKRYELS